MYSHNTENLTQTRDTNKVFNGQFKVGSAPSGVRERICSGGRLKQQASPELRIGFHTAENQERGNPPVSFDCAFSLSGCDSGDSRRVRFCWRRERGWPLSSGRGIVFGEPEPAVAGYVQFASELSPHYAHRPLLTCLGKLVARRFGRDFCSLRAAWARFRVAMASMWICSAFR